MPGPLSAVIMRLLEKEPDNRYQTAEGVIYDLERVRDAQAGPGAAGLRLGEHDVPLRLLPPSRLVGRDDEVAVLHGPEELGYPLLTEAMVDIRATLAEASRVGVIDTTPAARLVWLLS